MKKITALIFVGIFALTSQYAIAAKKLGFYGGIGGGVTSYDSDSEKLLEMDDDDGGFQVYGGIMLDKRVGLELGYYSFGDFKDSRSSDSAEVENMYAVALSLAPVIPVYKRLSLALRLGIAYWDADVTVVESSAKVSNTNPDDEFDVIYGLGPHIRINDHFAIQGGWDRLVADGDNVDMFHIGVRVSTK